jgi:hypothetical protein
LDAISRKQGMKGGNVTDLNDEADEDSALWVVPHKDFAYILV